MSERKGFKIGWVTYGPRPHFFHTDGRMVLLDEPSKYSDLYLSTMQDVVTTMSSLLSGVVTLVDAEVSRRVAEDPWAHRNQYGIWAEWDW